MNTIGQANPLYFIHGGTSEDCCLTPILQSSSHYNLRAEIITSADSHGPIAFVVARKIQKYLFNISNLPIGLSSARPQNPFPWDWRMECQAVSQLDFLNQEVPSDKEKGEKLFAELLAQEKDESVTLLVTSPWTCMKKVFKKKPALIKKIHCLFCIAGTFKEGNIFPDVVGGLKRPCSEWNVFWDPKAVSWILKNTQFSIKWVTLETCEEATITSDFLKSLEKQVETSPLSNLAFNVYQLAFRSPAYRFWNTLTALCMLHPDLYEKAIQARKVVVITDSFSEKEGALEERSDGREVSIIAKIQNMQIFYQYLLNHLK